VCDNGFLWFVSFLCMEGKKADGAGGGGGGGGGGEQAC